MAVFKCSGQPGDPARIIVAYGIYDRSGKDIKLNDKYIVSFDYHRKSELEQDPFLRYSEGRFKINKYEQW